MLMLIYKILLLLQSLKCSSPTQPRLHWSSYWQTTYASDKVPDYWNHGSIYLSTPQSKKVDIFSSWLARAVPIPKRHVTETTPGEDYGIYVYKRPTEKVFNINMHNEIEKEAKPHKADRIRDFTRTIMPQIEDPEAKSINTNSIFLRALASENNDFTDILQDIDNHPTYTTKSPIVSTKNAIIAESILRARAGPGVRRMGRPPQAPDVNGRQARDFRRRQTGNVEKTQTTGRPKTISPQPDLGLGPALLRAATPRPYKYHLTHPEYETTVYDYYAHPTSTIMHNTLITADSDSKIPENIFPKTAPRPKKHHFTRLELETTVYDYDIDDALLPYSTIKPKVTKSKEESESNSIFTAAKPEKYHFTHLDSETTVYDDGANTAYSPMKPQVTKSTRKAGSNSLIVDRISTKTPRGPEKNHLTRVESETTVYDDYEYPPVSIIKPSITKTTKKSDSSIITDDILTTKAPRVEKYHPEYETTTYDRHPTSTTMHTTAIKEELNSIITDNILTTREPTVEKYNFTQPERDTTVYDDYAYPPVSIIKPSITKTTKRSDSPIITDAIFITKAPRVEKYHPGNETTTYDRHPMSTTMHSTVLKEKSDSTITDNIITTRKSPKTRTERFTRLEYGKIVNYNIGDLYSPVSIINAKVMTSKSKYKSNIAKVYENDKRLNPSTNKGLSKTMEGSEYIDYAQANTAGMIRASTQDYDDQYQMNQKELSTLTTTHISSSKADHVPPIRAGNQEMETDAFSVFIVKLLIVLSVKRIEDFPVLIDQFREYMWMLLKDGQLGELGMLINSFLAKTVILLEQTQYAEVHQFLTKLQKVMANREQLLPKDINDIIDYMDDTYNKDEEQAMQAILKEASLFPNSRHNNKIAQGLIDYVFLKPMQRLVGTEKGNVLFKMMTEALKTHVCHIVKENNNYLQINNEIRRRLNFEKILVRSHPSKSTDRRSYEVTAHNKLYIRKEPSKAKIDGDIDNPSENSNTINRSYDANEHSDETENSEETKENKIYAFKDNDKFEGRNNRQHRTFSSAYELTTKTRKKRKYLSIPNNSRYQLKTKLHKLDHNNTPPNKHRWIWTTTVNSARVIENADSRNTEVKIKPKINENVNRENYRNYIASRRMGHNLTSTMNVPDDSHESDVERVLKSNVYKAMKKLHKHKQPMQKIYPYKK